MSRRQSLLCDRETRYPSATKACLQRFQSVRDNAMSNPPALIRCTKCREIFQPDLTTSGKWICPNCQAKNPNLKRHYRSVADLFILGFVLTSGVIAFGFSQYGPTTGLLIAAAHCLLLLVTIVLVYRSREPWNDTPAQTLIWIVFGLAILFNVVGPLLSRRLPNPGLLVVYGIIIPYLLWLHNKAKQAAVTGPQVTQNSSGDLP